jgi:hypothetical protein
MVSDFGSCTHVFVKLSFQNGRRKIPEGSYSNNTRWVFVHKKNRGHPEAAAVLRKGP